MHFRGSSAGRHHGFNASLVRAQVVGLGASLAQCVVLLAEMAGAGLGENRARDKGRTTVVREELWRSVFEREDLSRGASDPYF